MNKLALFLIPLVALGAIAGGVAASGSFNSCGYNEDGNFVSPDGTISAFGTMAAASECAAQGILPAFVAKRLGTFGDADTQQWAEEIKKLDAEAKQRLEEENAHG